MYVLFLCTAGMCDVTYIGVYNTHLHGKCFLSTLYNDISCITPPQSMLLFVSSDASSRVYATSRSSSLCTDQCHTSCRNIACSMFACAANTHDTDVVFLWKASAVSTSLSVDIRLSWDIVRLGLPLEIPLAVTFSSCEWIINSRMGISRKFLCVIFLPHDLCIRNACRMVMSVRRKNSYLVHFHALRAIP